ncbi:MAG: HAD family phosphatase [Firmicutes bacterium]|nr:HAD family phosphatase [Bacillota bacterium]
MKEIGYIIWDFDGTIADSMNVWVRSASNYLRSKGVKDPGDIDTMARPKGLMETVLLMKRHFELEETPQQIFDEICEQTGELYRHKIALKEGVELAIRDMAEAGLSMCIATASTPEHVWAALHRWGLAEHFDFIITCDDVGVGKYSPLIYQQAAERMNAEPEETLVIEDGLMGILSAKKAGFAILGVYEAAIPEKTAECHAASDIYFSKWSQWQGFDALQKKLCEVFR